MPNPARRSRVQQALVACALAAGLLILLAVSARPARAAFAGHNGHVAYDGRWSAKGRISVRNPDGKGLRRIRVPGRPIDPTFSPLGLRIAFATNGRIWIMQADGTNQRQLMTTPVPSRQPAWAPDGSQLVFSAGPRGASDIYRVDADDSSLTPLTHNPADETDPAWSRRGRIAFVRHTARGDGDIRVTNTNGGDMVRLTHGRVDDEMPAWSPDGRKLAFTRGSGAHRDIYVIRRDGSHLRRLTRLRQRVSSPAWSPNGRSIAFSMGTKGHRAVYVVRSKGGKVRRRSPRRANASSVDWQATGHDPVIAAAGDIACDPADRGYNNGLGGATECHQRQTSDVLLTMDLDAILPLGDTQYESGASEAYTVFDQTWGRLKNLMHPVVGNHESREPGATGYYDYFDGVGQADGPAGPRNLGWYSWDLGSWHMIALNSECSYPTKAPTMTDCAAGSPQEQWLKADLAAHPSRCTLVYFHHPLESSGVPQFNIAVQPFWEDMMAAAVDVVLAGHDHAYERFAPINALGQPDPEHGIRQFVVGTGGKNFTIHNDHKPGSEVRESSAFGVLQMTLGRGTYHWRFMPEKGAIFSDEGDGRCH